MGVMLTETGATEVATNTIVANLLELGTSVLEFINDNSMLSIMFAGSLVGVACYVVRKVKKTAKH